jgi:hypothetical protein
VRAGIYSSLRQIVDKKVLPSLSPLFDNQRLDRELRAMLKVNFKKNYASDRCQPNETNRLVLLSYVLGIPIRNRIRIHWIRMFFDPPGSGSISQRYGSGSRIPNTGFLM